MYKVSHVFDVALCTQYQYEFTGKQASVQNDDSLDEILIFKEDSLFSQAGEITENSLISEIFVSSSEKDRQYLFQILMFSEIFFIFNWSFQSLFLHCIPHSVSLIPQLCLTNSSLLFLTK
jgi:hypothetical protein